MKVKTVVLQEMMSKAIKGAGNDSQLPITMLVSMKLVNGVLTLTTTDSSSNYLYVKQAGVEGEDMSVVVMIEQLAKLVAKMTSEYITLDNKKDYLEVNGNGTYKVEIQLDENGEAVTYPDPYAEIDLETAKTIHEIKREDIQKILNTVKPALAVTLESEYLTGYYVNQKEIIASNREVVSVYETNLIDDKILIRADMMNLLDVITSKTFNVAIIEKSGVEEFDKIIFYSDDAVVYGYEMEGIEEWENPDPEREGSVPVVDIIQSFKDMDFPSVCKVSRNELLQVLDRLSLFVSSYDKETIEVMFTKDSMNIKSIKGTGYEQLKFVEAQNADSFEMAIHITDLVEQVKAQSGDTVEICYGLDNLIKMRDGKVTQFIALCMLPND